MNGFPVLIIYGGSRLHGLIADVAGLRLGDKFQDFWHGQPPKKESIGSHKRPGPQGTAERCVKGLLIV
jgi:hypothetical protein